MTKFTHPSTGERNRYIHRGLLGDIPESRMYDELRFSADNIYDVLRTGAVKPEEYLEGVDTVTVNENVEIADDYESFTEPRVLADILERSEITSIEADPDQGLYSVDTYKTEGTEKNWYVHMPFRNDSTGEVVGVVESPWGGFSDVFSYDGASMPELEGRMDQDIMDAAYFLQGETVRTVPDYSVEGVNEDYFLSGMSLYEEKLGLISPLEEEGQTQVPKDAHTGKTGPRGGSITKDFRNFLKRAKMGGLIDWTVSNDNKDNKIEMNSNGFKFLTRDVGKLGYSGTPELIDARLIDAWRK